MVSAVAVLCLVAGLLEGAFSLTCYNCNAVGKDCNTNDKPCDKAYDVCVSTITDVALPGKALTKTVVRSCGTKDMCNTNYSISLNATSLHAITKCCDKDRCAIGNIDVPKPTSDNDLECPTCYEPNEKCKNPVKIKCGGEEKKCVTYTTKEKNTKNVYSFQACATENVCTMSNITTLLHADQILMSKFNCNHAPSMLPGLVFPVAMVMAMLKLLS